MQRTYAAASPAALPPPCPPPVHAARSLALACRPSIWLEGARADRCCAQWWCKLQDGGRRTVTPLASMHRHPFEAVLLLRHQGAAGAAGAAGGAGPAAAAGSAAAQDAAAGAAAKAAPGAATAAAARLRSHADGLVFLSVPTAEHSRKPFLGPLLQAVLPPAAPLQPPCVGRGGAGGGGGGEACEGSKGGAGEEEGGQPAAALELFARELHAGWDSVGDEVLRFQDLARFECVEPKSL